MKALRSLICAFLLSFLALIQALPVLAGAEEGLQVDDATVVLNNKVDGPGLVSVFGTIRNTSDTSAEDLVVEARVRDASGNTVDVLSEALYGLIAPAKGEVAFKLQGAAAVAETSYATVEARVVSARSVKPPCSRAPKQSSGFAWSDTLVAWGPMLLLIIVWVLIARKGMGRGSAQNQMVELVKAQNQMFSRQLEALERIAEAMSNRKP